MPLQKINSFNLPALSDQNIVDLINLVINYTNDLEARLSALERPVERLSDEE